MTFCQPVDASDLPPTPSTSSPSADDAAFHVIYMDTGIHYTSTPAHHDKDNSKE